MKKTSFTTVERIENAIRTYKSDLEIHELDAAFPMPELKVNPEDIIRLIADYNQLSQLVKQTESELQAIMEMLNPTNPKK